MLQYLVKVGQWLRLLDDNAQLSLTNISVMISLYKLAAAPSTSFTDVGTVVASLLAYTAKKVIANGGSDGTTPPST